MLCNVVHLQVLFVGGLFEQFVFAGSAGESSLDQSAVRSMVAVQLAMNRINNKQDEIFDKLLPQTKVWCCLHFVHDLLQFCFDFLAFLLGLYSLSC